MLLGALLVLVVAGGSLYAASASSMTNSWAVQVPTGDADALAKKHGFINLGLVGNLKDVYHFVMPARSSNGEVERKGISEVPVAYHFTQRLQDEQNVAYVRQQERKKLFKKVGYSAPSDPNWLDQWSLLNTGQLNPNDTGRDMNIERAWLQGLTGCSSVVAVVDDGVEYTHSDLRTNYVSSIQFDFLRRQEDVFPITNDGVREEHGTNVAGEIAMAKGNQVCGIGVAYNSFITGLRLISTPGATDLDKADALSWQNGVVDIYSNSWGPEDSGYAVSGPGDLLEMVLEASTREGRGGKGNIYTFAAGNGGVADTCAADGYTNSIYTISVGSAASDGRQSDFDEMCSGKMVVTFDSNPYQDTRHVTTTNVQNQCYDEFSGTSASTPYVSGVIALLLEANPALTWRDVQYLLVYTSNRNNLVDGEWTTNGAGLRVSHKFGFGALDAEALVSRGRHWTTVPPQRSMDITPPNNSFTLDSGALMAVPFTVTSSDIVSLEHVVLSFSSSFVGITEEEYDQYVYNYTYNGVFPDPLIERGAIIIVLTSPMGTSSTLLPRRTGDFFPGSYNSWKFLSLHFWGENPVGEWTIRIQYGGFQGSVQATFHSVTLYGTSAVPEAVSRIPVQCSVECDPTRGCADIGAEFCDACAQLRVSSTLECTDSCPAGLSERNGYCYNSTLPETLCEAEKPSSSTPTSPLRFSSLLALALLTITMTMNHIVF